MPTITCNAKLFKIGAWVILLLPESASGKLPSRGMNMIKGTINGFYFQAPLEPDGKGSHWLKVDETWLKAAKADVGNMVMLNIEPAKVWPEPELPEDLKNVLISDLPAQKQWADVTAKAHWDWIRWINSTKNPETRQIRIEKTISKLKSGRRNPCCFNRNLCCEPCVSKNGILLEAMPEAS